MSTNRESGLTESSDICQNIWIGSKGLLNQKSQTAFVSGILQNETSVHCKWARIKLNLSFLWCWIIGGPPLHFVIGQNGQFDRNPWLPSCLSTCGGAYWLRGFHCLSRQHNQHTQGCVAACGCWAQYNQSLRQSQPPCMDSVGQPTSYLLRYTWWGWSKILNMYLFPK